MIDDKGVSVLKFQSAADVIPHPVNLLVSNHPFHHSYDILFGDESPVSGVGGVDHVVSCHEVVVVPELVALNCQWWLTPNSGVRFFSPMLSKS